MLKNLLQKQVLERGEQVRWTSAEGIRYYEVTGREPNGDKSSRGSAWTRPVKHSLKVVFFPVTLLLAAWMGDATFPGGTREDNIRTDLEIPAPKIRYEPGRERRLPGRFKPRTATYHRFTLPDGSGFDIRDE